MSKTRTKTLLKNPVGMSAAAAAGVLVLAMLVMLAGGDASDPCANDAQDQGPAEKEWCFVKGTLLTPETGASRNHAIRWDGAVSVAVVGATPMEREILQRVLIDINQLAYASAMNLHFIDGENPDMVIALADAGTYPRLARLMAMGNETAKGGFATPQGAIALNYEKDGRINKAKILIGRDSSNAAAWALLTQAVYRAAGPMGPSMRFPASVTHRAGDQPAVVMRLSPLDRKLMRFLYGHVKPGADEKALRAAFDAHWTDVPWD